MPSGQGRQDRLEEVLIHEIEYKIPGFRHTLLKAHVKRFLPVLEKVIGQPVLKECAVCGYPTTSEVCSYCRAMKRVVLPRSGGASGNTATGG